MSDFTSILKNLAGEWKLSRIISSGENFTGTANFKALSDSEYLLTESGELHMQDGSSIAAMREWHWAYPAQNELIISYNENPLRLYHHLQLKDRGDVWTGNAIHLCEPDTYDGAYEFSSGKILIEQKISGPKKDYSVESVYQR